MFENLSDRLGSVLKRLAGRGVLRPEDVDAALREVRMALLEADVNYKVVKEFGERVRSQLVGVEVSPNLTAPQQVVKVVHEELVALLGGNDRGRPAAIEQLRVMAQREKVDFHTGQGEAEVIARQAYDAAARLGADVVILDTAGRQAVDQELMDELRRIRSAVPVTESLLVADAMTGQEAVTVGRAFHDAVGIDGVFMTKLDGDARGCAALSLKHATGQTVRFAGVGEKPADLEVFHADRKASRILGMGDMLSLIEKAERTVDREEAAKVERNLRAGHLTFDDFLVQVRQLRGLGSIASVIEMMPGAGQLRGQLADQDPEAEVKKMEAIILSMTARERTGRDSIDGSRRRRIAAGSGTQVTDVNRLLKAREQMQQLVRQFGLAGPGGRRRRARLDGGLGRLFGG